MSGTEATTFFDTRAAEWGHLYKKKRSFKDRHSLFVSAVKSLVPKHGKILDFGCGPGILAFTLANEGYEILGIDGSAEMINVARAEAERNKTQHLHFSCMAADKLVLAPETYDAVICSSVIEYVEQDIQLVKELTKAIRQGGYLLVSVPHTYSLFGFAEDLVKKTATYTQDVGHKHLMFSLRRYKKSQFLAILRDCGFSPFQCTYFESPLPGKLGVALSRIAPFGVMLLVVAQKQGADRDPKGIVA